MKQCSHTFQGSEERTVVYVVGSAGRQHWQHVYTAVTRGRCRVYIVAEELHLRRAIKSKNVPRKTRLQRFLREAIAETNNCPKQMSSPLMKCWQSQELVTQSVSVTQGAPDPPELQSDLMMQGGSSVLSKEQTGSLLQSPCKRQTPAPEDVTKIPPVSISLLRKFKTNFCTLFHHHVSPGCCYDCFVNIYLIIFKLTSNWQTSQIWQMSLQSNKWLIQKKKVSCQ